VSKFKKDDFVLYDGLLRKVKKDSEDGYTYLKDVGEVQTFTLTRWKPKENEWVWVWNKLDRFVELRKFNRFELDSNKVITHLPLKGNTEVVYEEHWEFYEPFIGELPTRAK